MYVVFNCPPMPYLIVGGVSFFRKGDIHERRTLKNSFDLIFIVSGKLYLEENNKKFTVYPGQYIVLPPDRLHKGYECCDTDTQFYWLHFYTTGSFLLSEILTKHSVKKMNKNKYYHKDNFMISIPQYGSITNNVSQLKNLMEDISQVKIDNYNNKKLFFSPSISQIKYQQLFFSVLTYICDSNEHVSKNDLAEDIYDYLEANYKKSFDLTELSKIFSYHQGHIIRIVKQNYGMSPLQVLLSIRINKAKELLMHSNKSIGDISSCVGFEDVSYFSKQFKKFQNCTPSSYRKNINRY